MAASITASRTEAFRTNALTREDGLAGFHRPHREPQVKLRHDEQDRDEQDAHGGQRELHVPERVAEDPALQAQHDPDVALEQAHAD